MEFQPCPHLMWKFSLRLDRPVSVITTLSFSRKMLRVLRFLWTMPRACKYPMACATCLAMLMFFSELKGSDQT